MISKPLFKKELKSNLLIFTIFVVILAMYIPIVVYMFDPKLGETIKNFEKAMPQMMAAFGMITSGTDLISFIDSYLFGFIFLIFPMIFTIMLSNRLVASYIDSGSMANILSTPNTRKKIIITQITVQVTEIFLMILLAYLLTLISSKIMFPNELNVKRFTMMCVSLFLLQLMLGSISFLASCIFNETKNSYCIGAGIPLLFYLIKVLANMGGKLKNLKYATVFSLLSSDKIANGNTDVWLPMLIMLVGSVVLYSLSAYIFVHRDLPL